MPAEVRDRVHVLARRAKTPTVVSRLQTATEMTLTSCIQTAAAKTMAIPPTTRIQTMAPHMPALRTPPMTQPPPTHLQAPRPMTTTILLQLSLQGLQE
jgi:hypothetical protein